MDIKDIKNAPWLMSQEAFEIYSQCMYQADIEAYNQEIAELSARETVHIWAAIQNNQPTGIIILEQAANSAEIIGIAVKKEFQRCGTGKFMVYSAMQILKLQQLTAETDSDAVDFYRESGFAVKEFIRHFPDADVTRYNCQLDNAQKLPR